MTIREVLTNIRERLQNAGIEDFEYESWAFLDWKLHIDRAEFYMNPNGEVKEELLEELEDVLKQREQRVPLQYLMGECEFMGYDFYVDERVLIPRQDTECLVEMAIESIREKAVEARQKRNLSEVDCRGDTAKKDIVEFYENHGVQHCEKYGADNKKPEQKSTKVKVLDLCTGSGCIGISVAKLCPDTEVTLADISDGAFTVAKKNADNLCADVTLIKGNLFENIEGRFDYILSNPPYIPSEVIESLMPEVKEHEPRLALDGEADGLSFYRKIINEAPDYLNPDGRIYFEIGAEQGEDLTRLMNERGFSEVKVHKDLAGLDRIVTGIYSRGYK